MPTISVIIPVFNRQKLCERAVHSVLMQQFTDFECLIVDDGSTEPFQLPDALHDKRIRLLRSNTQWGVASARNRGVAASTGRWLAFLDSDDEWLPAKLRHQMTWLTRYSDCEIIQCREQWIRNGVRVNPPATHIKKGGMIFPESLERCMITPSSVLLSRSLYIRSGMFNESFIACEDYDLWLRITSRMPVGLIDSTDLIRYGGHDDQLSNTIPMLDRFRIRSMLLLIEHETLSNEHYSLVVKQLVKKATIVAHGFLKRGNREEYEHYQSIIAAVRSLRA